MSEIDSKDRERSLTLEGDEFVIEKKLLSLGKKYHIKDAERRLVGFCQEKSLKIKGELRVFTGEDENHELFRIKQRNMLDFTGTFEVIESGTANTIGFLKRNWVKSAVLGEWSLLDPDEKNIAKAKEDSLVKEVLRFKGLKRLPYRYKLLQNGKKIGVCKQRLSILGNTYKLQIEDKTGDKLDRRLLISLALLLDAVEIKFKKIGK